jgi:hypothetical protein
MTQTIGLPERYALEILQAWRSHDRERLSWNLARAAALELPGNRAEGERAEVLASVAAEMQEMAASGRTESEGVCLDLLLHLAHPEAGAYTAH